MTTTSSISRRELLVGMGAAAGLAACGGGGYSGRQLGVAVVGIGSLAQGQIIPALQESQRCRLAGLVSSRRERLLELGGRFGVAESGLYTYDDFDRVAENPDIDLVYIVVPNALHADFAIRAAGAGKHALCEKPLAVSVEQADAMMAAAAAAGTLLGVAYRLHYDPRHVEMRRLAREEVFGPVQLIQPNIGFPIGDDWRLDPELAGGGVLIEQGVYAVNAACTLADAEPVEVVGYETKTDPQRFARVEESAFWSMQFPGGAVAHCAASYTLRMNRLWAGAASGFFELEPAYTYNRLRGTTSAGSLSGSDVNQFALQLDAFAASVQEGVPLAHGSAEEGARDVRIMAAIYESIRRGAPVRLT